MKDKFFFYISLAINVLIISLVISDFLTRESKNLLLGESISNCSKRTIVKLAETYVALTMLKIVSFIYRSTEEGIGMVMISTQFKTDVGMAEQLATIERITKNIQSDFLPIRQDFIKPV